MTTVRVRSSSPTVVVDNRNNATVVRPRPNSTTVRTGTTPVTVGSQASTTTVQDRRPTIAIGSNIGPRGPKGEPGDGTITLPAGATIHGLRAVRASSGQLYHPDIEEPDHAEQVVGIAMQSGNTGTSLQVRAAGRMTEPSWTWGAGAVYCGADGVLTQTPPAAGWILKVGTSLNATTLLVDIDNPFFRS